jgi:hypothetical protein
MATTSLARVSTFAATVAGIASTIASTGTILLSSNRLLTSDLGMAHLLAVGALYAGIVSGKRALSALVTLRITVTAHNLARISAVLLPMTFFTTVVASAATAASLWAVTREMTNYSH